MEVKTIRWREEGSSPADSFREAEEWDIRQHISMTPEERQEVSRQLRIRYYGEDRPDVRDKADGR